MEIFSLKTSADQLERGNGGVGSMHYVQYAPSRDVTGNNFPNGAQYIKWNCSGTKWWIPARSYLRLRYKLTDGQGNELVVGDDVAPNMNMFANLFQSSEFRINNQTVCRISDYMPQIDALTKRLRKSQSWLDTIGSTTINTQPSFYDRQQQIVSDGVKPDDYILSKASLAGV